MIALTIPVQDTADAEERLARLNKHLAYVIEERRQLEAQVTDLCAQLDAAKRDLRDLAKRAAPITKEAKLFAPDDLAALPVAIGALEGLGFRVVVSARHAEDDHTVTGIILGVEVTP